MNVRAGRWLPCLVGLGIILAGCAAATPTATAVPSPTTLPSPAPTASPASSIQDIMELEPLGPIETGTYFIDPDGDASTPLRVVYEVPAEGWSEWIGAAKFSDVGHVGVSITTVTNLVAEGCRDHSWADPAVGPSVDELAAALADLAPFEVTSPPRTRPSTATAGSTSNGRCPTCRSRERLTSRASPAAMKATSRAGSRSSTRANLGMRSTATPALATTRSSGSWTPKGPVS